MAGNKNKFPPHIKEILNKKGYFSLTAEERVNAHKKCLEELEKVPNPDYEAGKRFLRNRRGGVI